VFRRGAGHSDELGVLVNQGESLGEAAQCCGGERLGVEAYYLARECGRCRCGGWSVMLSGFAFDALRTGAGECAVEAEVGGCD